MKKYKEDIFCFLLLGIVIFCILLTNNLNGLDEIWIFNMARNIANGLLPYKDFNMITPPGLPILCGAILKLFGTELFIMRILAIFLNTSILFCIYKILKLFNINKYWLRLIMIIITGMFINILAIDYNLFILFIALTCLYIELKNYYKTKNIYNYNKKNEFMLGIWAGCSILMKQTTGIYFVIVFIGYKLLAVKNKEDFKEFLKIVITRLSGVMIPIILLLVYLTYNNIISNFIDYAILGIKNFSNSVPYIYLLKGETWYLAILLPVIIISSFIIYIKRKENILLILGAYSISTIIVVYPIADTVHLVIAGIIAIITGIYMLTKLYKKKIKTKINAEDIYNSTKLINTVTKIFIIIIVFSSISKLVFYIQNCSTYDSFPNLKYIPVSEELEQQIIEVDKYIQGKKEDIYILDASAAIYMIPLDRYNKNYDMFLVGNFGGNGSQSIIDDLKNKENAILLIRKDEKFLNWQTPKDIIEYIKDNWGKDGEIEIFDIYKKEK